MNDPKDKADHETKQEAEEESPRFRHAAAAREEGTPGTVRPFLTEDEWRERRRMEPVGKVVDRIMNGIGGASAAPGVMLGARWEEVVGPDFAAKTAPGSCKSGKLVILVKDGATASKMRFATSQILQHAAEIAGEGVVSTISFRVSPSLSGKATT